ncbi:MAG: TetR/AcrR family transcriptional regulator [Spirochaetales bacterium]|uniref:TetR/AcrR family transcriptional regulator n=1 Tax=Candidatus Thalassospirochaeta sargassi TaxID=3119039 RepID=A0AAJ1MK59_9SPIO|nr:TetR/AcrR family transcriptional regulator [Spirochaetales bacterium]
MEEKIRGKQAVMAAVVKAATELFSESAPSSVSIRDIAAKAGVNHGLIHRHFGSKQNLMAEVLAGIDSRLKASAAGAGSFNEAFEKAASAAIDMPEIWKIPARLVMDGEIELLTKNRKSYLADLRTRAKEQMNDKTFYNFSPDESLLMLISLGFGLEMFGDYISSAMGIENPDVAEVLKKIIPMFPVGNKDAKG